MREVVKLFLGAILVCEGVGEGGISISQAAKQIR